MDSHFEDLLRGHLERLFKNERMSIADFQQWFMTAWWEAEDGASESLYEFGSRIEHLLYIWSSGEWSDKALLQQLQQAAHNHYGNESAAVPSTSAAYDPAFATPENRITTRSTGSVLVVVLDRLFGVDVIPPGPSPVKVRPGRPQQVLAVS